MEDLLKALGCETEEDALARIQEMRDALSGSEAQVTALQAQVNQAEIDKAIADKKLLPAQKGLAEKLLAQSRELYDEFVANAAVPDLTTEVEINDGGDDGLDPFKNVQSFGDLLKDPALAKQMAQDNPERYNSLYKAYMKGGN